MSSLRRRAVRAAPLVAFALLTSCGQRGPLTLPDSAQPIERLDPNRAAEGAPATVPAQEPDPQDDEQRENER
jgi:predicted small lipoprotein YifL